MAKARPFDKTALVIGVLSTCNQRVQELTDLLVLNFGPIKSISPSFDFSYTDYYDKEMSGRPKRWFVLFEKLVDPSTLADIKTRTNQLEMQFLGVNGRTVNLDPGTLSLSNFVLATCKDRSHRIALKDGIYAETTLIYQDKDFQRLPWTYADYSSDEVKAVLRQFRDLYRQLLKV